MSAYPIEEGPAKAVPGIGADDLVVAWTDHGLLVVPNGRHSQGFVPPVGIFRVNPDTGKRELFTTLGAEDAPDGTAFVGFAVTPDEKLVADSYERRAATLYLYEFRPDPKQPARQR